MDLDWPGCRNVRDVGGLPTADGRVVREGVLIRADSLQYLTADGIEAVRRSGVSRILDLRGDGEVAIAPTPFTGTPLAVRQSLVDPADPDHGQATIVSACTWMLDKRPELFAAAVKAIADEPDGAVVVHCHGGKDRTGMIVALALSVAGVPEEEIVADYYLTQSRLAQWLEEQLAEEPDVAKHPELIEFRDTRAESIVEILRHLDEKYGGPEAYLRQGGLTDEDLTKLRARLVA
ncbi:protein tyrosine/serine phosphatase [Kribbella sp. VKM Ac-2571]|uniref:tyrosine-protein phosphatase n=1 Tax=Kribbella sp. VKM Ac-2571 TaxID=2512222 RepID=UPI00105E3C5F|nr:tyrosine-protein phosphatase [Kribbella sp. VKM Ac-2571]TDO47579.1 protein tyrosine/serine phosphatase [Kribbella sp. VKM Ac-2571]